MAKNQITIPFSNDPLLVHSEPTKYTRLKPTQLKAAVAAGLLPEPVRLGARLRGWRKSSLDALIGNTTPTITAQ